MLAGVMAPQRSLAPSQFSVRVQPASVNFSTSSLSLGLTKGNKAQTDGGANNTEVQQGMKSKEVETESKSSYENMEGGSGEEHEDPRPTKKRYPRHTLHQISEMERQE